MDDRVARSPLAHRAVLPQEARAAEREEDLLRQPVRVRWRGEPARLDPHAVDADPLRTGCVPDPLPRRRHRPLLAPESLHLVPVRKHAREYPPSAPPTASEAGRTFDGSAGERTRTSKGRLPQRDLNPSRLPVPPRPRFPKDRADRRAPDTGRPGGKRGRLTNSHGKSLKRRDER